MDMEGERKRSCRLSEDMVSLGNVIRFRCYFHQLCSGGFFDNPQAVGSEIEQVKSGLGFKKGLFFKVIGRIDQGVAQGHPSGKRSLFWAKEEFGGSSFNDANAPFRRLGHIVEDYF